MMVDMEFIGHFSPLAQRTPAFMALRSLWWRAFRWQRCTVHSARVSPSQGYAG